MHITNDPVNIECVMTSRFVLCCFAILTDLDVNLSQIQVHCCKTSHTVYRNYFTSCLFRNSPTAHNTPPCVGSSGSNIGTSAPLRCALGCHVQMAGTNFAYDLIYVSCYCHCY